MSVPSLCLNHFSRDSQPQSTLSTLMLRSSPLSSRWRGSALRRLQLRRRKSKAAARKREDGLSLASDAWGVFFPVLRINGIRWWWWCMARMDRRRCRVGVAWSVADVAIAVVVVIVRVSCLYVCRLGRPGLCRRCVCAVWGRALLGLRRPRLVVRRGEMRGCRRHDVTITFLVVTVDDVVFMHRGEVRFVLVCPCLDRHFVMGVEESV